MSNNSTDMKYFVFSQVQMKEQKEVSRVMGKNYNPKTVIINGAQKVYTDILDDPSKSLYTDAMVVASGDLNDMKYTK